MQRQAHRTCLFRFICNISVAASVLIPTNMRECSVFREDQRDVFKQTDTLCSSTKQGTYFVIRKISILYKFNHAVKHSEIAILRVYFSLFMCCDDR